MSWWRVLPYSKKRGIMRVPPECSKVMPCGCDDYRSDGLYGPHLRLFVWWGNRHREPLGAWRCTSCGAAKAGSVERRPVVRRVA